MTTKLYAKGSAAVTVRDPDGQQRERMLFGTRDRAISGALVSDIIGSKMSWSVTWRHLSSAQWATLSGQLDQTVLMSWQPPDSATAYDVYIQEYAVEHTEFGWSATARLEQA